jgi:hypothetical protein
LLLKKKTNKIGQHAIYLLKEKKTHAHTRGFGLEGPNA